MSRHSVSTFATPQAKTPRFGAANTGARTSLVPGSVMSSARRSSIFRGIGGPSVFKDKRNITSPAFKNAMNQKIIDFMEGEITIEEIRHAPTRKVFIQIFEYIYGTWQELYTLPKAADEQNAEIIRIFKALGYPITLKNSTLSSFNAPTSWPHVLAALGWLIDAVNFFANANSFEDNYMMNDSSDFNYKAFRYQSDAAVCKKYFAARKNGIPESQLNSFVDGLCADHLTKYEQNINNTIDLSSRVKAAEERIKLLQEEIQELEEEKEGDMCQTFRIEIKKLDADIEEMQRYVDQLNVGVGRHEEVTRDKQKVLETVEQKVAMIKAQVDEKKARIAEQTARCGHDGAAIRAAAMEKAALTGQLVQLNKELEKVSQLKFNLVPKANARFAEQLSRYRRLIVRIYDMRSMHLADQSRPLLDKLPTDIRGLQSVLATEVRRLVTKTKADIETHIMAADTEKRRLTECIRRIQEEEFRVDKEYKEQMNALDKENRERMTERAEWEKSISLKERELNAVTNELEQLRGAEKEVSKLDQMIEEAKIDLNEAATKATDHKTRLDDLLYQRTASIIEEASAIGKRISELEATVNAVEVETKRMSSQ